MKRSNDHAEFVGLANLITKNNNQVALFEQWAKNNDWQSFHTSHYDWWMFPIDQPSRLGFAYTIYESEIETLKTNPQFIQNIKRGAELLLRSWGWELYREKPLKSNDQNQCWQNWPIRLYKCAQCLQLFNLEKELKSVQKYGEYLLENNESFLFRGKDLSSMFL